MNIPKQYKDLLGDELKAVSQRVSEAISDAEKLYFFSAAHGMINRVMNFYCDPTLVFMHQVLQAAHQSFTNRLNGPKTPDTVSFMGLPQELLKSLFEAFESLRSAFEEDSTDSIREALERISVLTYATTGNGFYLYTSGRLEI